MNNQIHKVVLTGGPCSGKSTSLARLKQHFEDRWVNVLVVPEAATHLFSGMGVKIGKEYLSGRDFQEENLTTQLEWEARALRIAKKYQGQTLILMDRGILDGKAYVSSNAEYRELLGDCGLSEWEVLSTRYDGVIHLVTAAEWAEEYYTLANNEARKETPEEARALDVRLKNAYIGTTKLSIVDNSLDFNHKMRRVEEIVAHILGIPVPLESERKFIVDISSFNPEKVGARKVEIFQTYLSRPGEIVEERIRKRTIDGGNAYYHTIKKPGPDGARFETESIISEKEFTTLLERSLESIRKTRYCFIHKNAYFELDVFENQYENIFADGRHGLLEIELLSMDEIVEIPEFLSLVREVTDDADFKNRNLAR